MSPQLQRLKMLSYVWRKVGSISYRFGKVCSKNCYEMYLICIKCLFWKFNSKGLSEKRYMTWKFYSKNIILEFLFQKFYFQNSIMQISETYFEFFFLEHIIKIAAALVIMGCKKQIELVLFHISSSIWSLCSCCFYLKA